MALAISDLQYDLLTLVRTYDRANDFTRADEYRAMLDRVERNEVEWEEAIEEMDQELREAYDQCAELDRQRDINLRLLNTIAGIARDALASTEDRDDIDDNEAELIDALATILSHAEA